MNLDCRRACSLELGPVKVGEVPSGQMISQSVLDTGDMMTTDVDVRPSAKEAQFPQATLQEWYPGAATINDLD